MLNDKACVKTYNIQKFSMQSYKQIIPPYYLLRFKLTRCVWVEMMFVNRMKDTFLNTHLYRIFLASPPLSHTSSITLAMSQLRGHGQGFSIWNSCLVSPIAIVVRLRIHCRDSFGLMLLSAQ